MTLFKVFQQNYPIRTGEKDEAGLDIFEANFVPVGTVEAPSDAAAIEQARAMPCFLRSSKGSLKAFPVVEGPPLPDDVQ